MKLQSVIVVICVGLISGCSTPWHDGATIKTGDGKMLCAKHRIPLITVRAYTYPPKPLIAVDPTEAWGKAADCYPNLWPFYASEEASGGRTYPTKVSYCPQCQRAAEHIIK